MAWYFFKLSAPPGEIIVFYTKKGARSLRFSGGASQEPSLTCASQEPSPTCASPACARLASLVCVSRPREWPELAGALAAYFSGEAGVGFLSFPLDLEGCSPFARRVLEVTRRVPPGRVCSYSALAARAGVPGAARGVGRAMAANPLPVIIPCHRVVRKDGRPGGYSGGTGLKRWLLQLEGLGFTESGKVVKQHEVFVGG